MMTTVRALSRVLRVDLPRLIPLEHPKLAAEAQHDLPAHEVPDRASIDGMIEGRPSVKEFIGYIDR